MDRSLDIMKFPFRFGKKSNDVNLYDPQTESMIQDGWEPGIFDVKNSTCIISSLEEFNKYKDLDPKSLGVNELSVLLDYANPKPRNEKIMMRLLELTENPDSKSRDDAVYLMDENKDIIPKSMIASYQDRLIVMTSDPDESVRYRAVYALIALNQNVPSDKIDFVLNNCLEDVGRNVHSSFIWMLPSFRRIMPTNKLDRIVKLLLDAATHSEPRYLDELTRALGKFVKNLQSEDINDLEKKLFELLDESNFKLQVEGIRSLVNLRYILPQDSITKLLQKLLDLEKASTKIRKEIVQVFRLMWYISPFGLRPKILKIARAIKTNDDGDAKLIASMLISDNIRILLNSLKQIYPSDMKFSYISKFTGYIDYINLEYDLEKSWGNKNYLEYNEKKNSVRITPEGIKKIEEDLSFMRRSRRMRF